MRYVSLFLGLSLLCGSLSAEEIDLESLESRLAETETAFAATVERKDFEAFLSFIDEPAVFSGSGGELRGREAIGQGWSALFAPEAPPFSWKPERVVVMDDGQLGLSTGPYWMESKTAEGETVRRGGTFFSVWRRQSDGSWKIILDTGTPPTVEPPPAPSQQQP